MIASTRVAIHLMGWFALLMYPLLFATLYVGSTYVASPRESWESLSHLSALIGLTIWYFVFGLILRTKHERWDLYLVKEEEGVRQFSGIPLLAVWIAFIWRYITTSVVINGVAAALKTAYSKYLNSGTELTIDMIAFLFSSYLAFVWLLNYQYGDFKLVRTGNTQLTAQPKSQPVPRVQISGDNLHISDSISYLRSFLVGSFSTVAVASYLLIGLIQLSAVYSFFREYWGWWWIPSALAAFFVGYMPLVGTVAGLIAARTVWEWSIVVCALIFGFPLVVMSVVGLLSGVHSVIGRLYNK